MSSNSSNADAISLKPATRYTSTSLRDAVKLRIGTEGIAATAPQTIPQIFRECCKRYANFPAVSYDGHGDNDWTIISYATYQLKVERTALLLSHVGLQPHTSVGVLANNCPEWFYVEFGAILAGGIIAGIYPTSSPEVVLYSLKTAEATVCVVEDADQLAKVRAVKSQLPHLKAIIQLYGPYDDSFGVEKGYFRWSDLFAMQFDDASYAELKRRELNIGANECAMLLFTSGTTGMPKAAMISHDSLIMNIKCANASLTGFKRPNDVAICYLPLNHAAAQMFEVFLCMVNGDCVYFAERNALKGTIFNTVLKVRPTYFSGVPRIFEKMQERIKEIESESSQITRYIMNWAREFMVESYTNSTKVSGFIQTLKYFLATNIAYQMRSIVGLEFCKRLVVGGAPLTIETKEFFLGINLPLNNMYGMTESSGGVTCMIDHNDKYSVGKVFQGIEIKIDQPNAEGYGEVCFRGRCIMMGYCNEPVKTAEVIDAAGWLHSGDLGYLKDDGALVITGRLKEIVITAGGENIPPLQIEGLVKSELPCVSNALLIGDNRKYLTILLTLKTHLDADKGMPLDQLQPDTIEWLLEIGLNYTRLSELLKIPAKLSDIDAANIEVKPDQRILAALQAGLDRVNAKAISHAYRVQKFTLLPHDFSMPTGELGPTLKLRRSVIIQKYANVIERMYY